MANQTVKRLLILGLVIALIGGGGYLLWRRQVSRMAQGVVARAGQAEQGGDFAKAAELYRQHLAVVPGDVEIELKYADVIIKSDRSERRLNDALGVFEGILGRDPSRRDVRRRAAEVASELAERGAGSFERAHKHLASLLDGPEADGHLEYLMARCYEHDGDFDRAATTYESAIAHGAPEVLDASRRLATLLRDKRGDKDKAEQVIDAMVKSAPDDYRTYLGRGKYREGHGDIKGAGDDFRRALQLASDRPEVYLEVARVAEREKGFDAARQVLKEGLAAAPKAVELYLALSRLEARAGRTEKAAEALDSGLKVMPDRLELRWMLALLLAERGDAGRLLLQIDELEKLGAARPFTQYLRAYYHLVRHDFLKAKQILGPLQSEVAGSPPLKAQVNILLSRVSAELSEPELAREAMVRAYSANPEDQSARLGWIQVLINRGELDEAIRECRRLQADHPGTAWRPLADLLIERNRRLPEARRRWVEVEKLIDQAEASSSGPATAPSRAVDAALLRVELLLAKGEEAKAFEVLEAARARSPGDARPWLAQARLLIRRKDYDGAKGALDRAEKQFGDRVDLRLVRADLAVARGGDRVVPALNELAGGLDHFSREDRRLLLTELAVRLIRQQDLEGAGRAWSQLAEEEPESLEPRLRLFELALQSGHAKQAEQSGDANQVEGRIREIEGRIDEIARLDEQSGKFCRAQFLAWLARSATKAADKENGRAAARGLLNELKVSRPDWAKVPLALARLDQEEFAEAGRDESRRAEKLESAIASYRRAIELGLRDPAALRELVRLLVQSGRGNEALEVYSLVPAIGQLPGGLERLVSQVALERRELRQAEDLARRSVEANPGDFQARLWLSQVLLATGNRDEAGAVLQQAVAADQADPDRWANLVVFLAQIARQPEKAEKVVDEAAAHIARAPLVMAQCCGVVGRSYEAGDLDKARSWFGRARHWYDEAQKALKDPADLTVKRRLAEFLLQTNQAADAEGLLKEIVARTAVGKSPEFAGWARRSLALLYAQASPPRIAEALALLSEKAGKPEGEPEDLRLLALIHASQGTPAGRQQAIGDIRALIGREAATPDDRLRLAQLLDAAGEWGPAREQFRELILRTEGAPDARTLTRRPLYLDAFFDALIRHHRPGDDSDLAEARQLLEKLRPLRRDSITPVVQEARLEKAAGQAAAAAARLREFADRPELTAAGRLRLAEAAEQIGLFDAAEPIYRRVAAEPPVDPKGLPNWSRLAAYLARRGRVKDAIDLCEAHWADEDRREQVASICLVILGNPDVPLDKEQADRVIGWLEQARLKKPQSLIFPFLLGSLYDRLGEYSKAKERYRDAIKVDDRNAVASNNLAWLIALTGGEGDEALALINRAIGASGANPEFLDTRGMVYLAVGDGRHAVADLKAALEAAPSPSKYFHLAQAYLRLNDRENARRILEAGKNRGLPSGLHRLELALYNKMSNDLGMH